jgi:hypothetical protein
MYYISFLHGNDMFIMKIDAGPEMRIKQSVSINFKDEGYKDIMVPRFLIQDPSSEGSLFLIGQYEYRGSFIKLAKSNLKSTWKMQFKNDYKYEIDA